MAEHDEVIRANRRYYATVAEGYFENPCIRGYYTPALLDAARHVLLEMSVPSTQAFLDFGCGQGTLSRIARERFAGVWGVDVSEEMLRRVQPAGRVVQGDGLRLPFREAFFDMIGAYGVMHHICDWRETLTELHRLLRPGGALFTDADPNGGFYSLFRPLIMLRRRLLSKRAGHGDLAEVERLAEYHQSVQLGFDTSALARHLEQIGMVEITIEYHTQSGWLSRAFSAACRLALPPDRAFPLFRLTARKRR